MSDKIESSIPGNKFILKHSENDWDIHFLKIAKLVSKMSKDPSTKVGSVMTSNKRIVSTGYNGFPEEVPDIEEWYLNREIKYKHIIHAEKNAIINCPEIVKYEKHDKAMYIYPLKPCDKCFKKIIKNGIKKIVSVKHEIINGVCNVCKKDICSEERWPITYNFDIIYISENDL